MADGYDRFDSDGGGGGSFVMGLLTGTVLGAGLGMLFAPKSGSELRGQISEQANSLANSAQEGYRRATENAGEWVDRGREFVDKARDAVARGADEAQRYARDAASNIRDAASNVTGSPSTASGGGSSSSSYGSSSSYPSENIHGSQPSSTPGSGSRRS